MSELTDFLNANASNRGLMATLRCALVSSKEVRAWPVLSAFGGIGRNHHAEVVRTVAGLFATWHDFPKPSNGGFSMGSVCRMLCSDDELPGQAEDKDNKPIKPGPMGRRFSYLIDSERSEICQRVSRLVLYAKSKRVPVDYEMLEKDLEDWPWAKERWAKDFWSFRADDLDHQESEEEE